MGKCNRCRLEVRSLRRRRAIATVSEPLISELHKLGFQIAIEANGTKPAPPGIDWICVSPKAGVHLLQNSDKELKLGFPQEEVDSKDLEHLAFEQFFLQPLDGPERTQSTSYVTDYSKPNPLWRLSPQIQKFLGIR